MNSYSDIPAVLLVGGSGTRLRSVLPSVPKPLASLGEESFLELLVRHLAAQGICRLVMCTGYLADQIETEFGDGSAWGVTIEYSREQCAMGTAGAVKLAQAYLGGASQFLVMNGDSFVEIDFARLIDFHREHDGIASMAAVHAKAEGRYGTLEVTAGNRVARFAEKTSSDGSGLVNAGVYVFDQVIFDCIGEGPGSLEKEVFPSILDRGIYALETDGLFIDIGIPEDYARAKNIRQQLYEAIRRGKEEFHAAKK
jgi:NDP-sugar pyrophosphorylase family protein